MVLIFFNLELLLLPSGGPGDKQRLSFQAILHEQILEEHSEQEEQQEEGEEEKIEERGQPRAGEKKKPPKHIWYKLMWK